MSRAVRYQPGFNDFNDGPPNSGSAGFEFRANDKLNHGLWVSNSAHNGKMKWVLFLASYVKFNVE